MHDLEKTRSQLIEELQAAHRRIAELETHVSPFEEKDKNNSSVGKVEHLNAVLRAIRNVNQLIVQEESPDHLIRKACNCLTETLGYFNAWMVRFDRDENVVSMAHSNVSEDYSWLEKNILRGDWPDCAKKAFSCKSIVITKNPETECKNCNLSSHYQQRTGYCTVLRHDGKVFGLLSVSVPGRFAEDEEEQSLFKELADDLAFALYRIDLEGKNRRDEPKIRMLFQQAADAIFVCAQDGSFLEINEQACLRTGYSRKELLGMNVADVDVQIDDAQKMAEFVQSMMPDQPVTLQSRHHRKDGSIYPVEVTISRIETPDGDRLMGMARDVSERNEAIQAYKESEERFRTVIENLPAALFIHDTDGNLVLVNKAACQNTGYSYEEILNKKVHDLDPASIQRKDKEFLWHNSESVIESRLVCKNGTSFPVEIHLNPIRLDGKPLILAIAFNISERKRLETERANRELFLSRLIDQSPFATWIADEKGTLIQANPALKRALNLTDEQLVGKYNVLEDPHIKEQGIYHLIESVFTEGKTVRFEAFWNGEHIDSQAYTGSKTVYIDSTMFPVYDSDGKLVHAVLNWIDITDRKKAENALKAALHEQEAIFESSMVGIMVIHHDRIISKVNRRMADMLGYTQEEMTNVSPRPFHVSHEHFVDFGKSYYWRLAEKEQVQIEFPFRHKNGDTVWCLFSGKAFAPPDLTKGVVWVIDDITERKRMQDELIKRNSAAKQAEILAETGYFERNWLTGKGYWSDGFCRLLGLDPGEILDHDDFMTFVHGEDRQQTADHIKDCLAYHRHMDVEFRIVQKHGKILDIHGIGETEYNEKGQPWKTRGTFQNITKRKGEEEKRKKLEEQLRQSQKMESIGRLAGGIAHDFNNLLTGISGNISLALMDLGIDDPVVEMLEEIDHASQSAADLTRQLLAFSRKQIIKPKNLDLNKQIDTMHRMLVRLIGEDIELKTIFGSDVGTIKADPGQLEQILINLAVNARDAMPKGGKMIIETANASLDLKYCMMNPDVEPGSYVMFAISDTGDGMDEDTLAKVFDPFFTTKQEGEGTGLGLATVYGIIKQHNGHIKVYSEIGQGTTFKVYFPRVLEHAEDVVRQASAGDLPKGTETILVVEDETMVRKIALKILKRQGYQVLEADCGANALTLVEKTSKHIDLLMTDIVMPKMNGRELAEKLCKRLPDLKVLFTSGYTENVIAHHGVLEKGLNFIGKPYTPLALAKKVRHVLDKPKNKEICEGKKK